MGCGISVLLLMDFSSPLVRARHLFTSVARCWPEGAEITKNQKSTFELVSVLNNDNLTKTKKEKQTLRSECGDSDLAK